MSKTQKLDTELNPIPAWQNFSTSSKTLGSDDTYEQVEIPERAAEVLLKSSADFTVSESAAGVGYSTSEIKLQVVSMTKLYIKGSENQVIQILWGIL